MPKFFVEPQQVNETFIRIEGENVNHMKNVLRLVVEDEILINDRQGNDYKCIISEIEQHHIIAQIQLKSTSETEPSVEVTLYQPLIKGEKIEWVFQKAVEIGVTHIIPVMTERCVVKIETSKKIQAKLDRWNKITEAAAKQSGRGIVPVVAQPMTFKEAIVHQKTHNIKSIIPYENEDKRGIRDVLQASHSLKYGIFIGPEGGFTEAEVAYALEAGVQSVTLGKRILRSETASLVALTNIMYEMGEMDT
ncbi:MAG: 16S rRNA (uracil(1498)-N(3))-methyltransferase [Cellulosilyticaceae bacterium]